VLLGNGDGTFQATQNSTVGGVPNGLAVGDFNGDGLADLVLANYAGSGANGTVSILLSNGDGTFQAAQNFPVGVQPWSVAVADFNGDGNLDLAVTNSNWSGQAPEGSVTILLGNGGGSFQAAANYRVGIDPRTVVAGDFNGDGHLDIAVANIGYTLSAWSLSVLLGNGDGTFQPARNYPTFPAAADDTGSHFTLGVADFNGDGHLDLAMTGQFGAVVWLGRGDGSFEAGPTYHVGTGSVAVADFNQDGQADLAVTNAEGNAVGILLGMGDGTFQASPGYPVGLGTASAVAVGDFNGDGNPDVAVGSMEFNTGSVVLLRGTGNGTFQNAGNLPADACPVGVGVADFNGDGNQDLLITVDYPGLPRYHLPAISGVRVWLGHGDGTFSKAFTDRSNVGTYGAAVGDFNGDGNPDLVEANYGWPGESGNTATVLLGNGDGTFGASRNYPVLAQPSAVAVADFNGDGILDVAVAALGGLSILLGKGDGTLQPAQNYPEVPGTSLAVADFNGDGFLDLALWHPGTPGSVHVLLGQGDGTFQPGPSYLAGSASPEGRPGLVAGDFNGDGILDLALSDSVASSVSVLLGKGDGTFAEPQYFAVGFPVNGLAVADFNGDGNLDMAVCSGSTVTILINDGNWPP
jgi:hypothetical protein